MPTNKTAAKVAWEKEAAEVLKQEQNILEILRQHGEVGPIPRDVPIEHSLKYTLIEFLSNMPESSQFDYYIVYKDARAFPGTKRVYEVGALCGPRPNGKKTYRKSAQWLFRNETVRSIQAVYRIPKGMVETALQYPE